jgi:hypothetical protein
MPRAVDAVQSAAKSGGPIAHHFDDGAGRLRHRSAFRNRGRATVGKRRTLRPQLIDLIS